MATYGPNANVVQYVVYSLQSIRLGVRFTGRVSHETIVSVSAEFYRDMFCPNAYTVMHNIIG